MSGSGRHYEKAFEDFLAVEGLSYVPVSAAQSRAFRLASLKAFDFVVWPTEGPTWLVDLKGRKSSRGRLENWVTLADVEGLTEWQAVFGSGFVGMLVFAYAVAKPDEWPHQQAPLHKCANRYYSFWVVPVDDYSRLARPRSARWKTCAVPAKMFKSIAAPVSKWLIGENVVH